MGRPEIVAPTERLEERALITRRRRGADQRVVEVDLAPRGVAIAEAAPEAAQGRLLYALHALPAADVRRLSGAVRWLVDAMEATDVLAEFFFADG
jgi:DNA-binding MarR family transcriptional regulator